MTPYLRSETSLIVCLALAATFGALMFAASACTDPDRQIRVVLITLDTLRYDSFSGAPGIPPSTANLREWAADATVFERSYSATATTRPSHASMLTGLHPWHHSVIGNRQVLADHHVTVTERLKEAGFSTSAVVASLPVNRESGLTQGFDTYNDEFVKGSIIPGRGLHQTAPPESGRPYYVPATMITDRAIAAIESGGSSNQFFWVHYFDPHAPYGDSADGETLRPLDLRTLRSEEPPEVFEQALAKARRLYDKDVEYLDRELARLLERLEKDAASIDTHILITADHGESFGEQGAIGHGRHLIESQLHVPCMVKSARVTPGPRQDATGSVDVATTLLAMAGLIERTALNPSSAGRDLTRIHHGNPRAYGMRRTWLSPPRKTGDQGLVFPLDEYVFFMADEKGDLYRGNFRRVIADSRSSLTPEDAAPLKELFSRFEGEIEIELTEPLVDEETERGLKALGYVK